MIVRNFEVVERVNVQRVVVLDRFWVPGFVSFVWRNPRCFDFHSFEDNIDESTVSQSKNKMSDFFYLGRFPIEFTLVLPPTSFSLLFPVVLIGDFLFIKMSLSG